MFPRLLRFALLSCCVGRLLAGEPPPPLRAATAAEVSMLNEVLQAVADDWRRWAYTEHIVQRDPAGRTKAEQIVRCDPSQPYAEQWTPLQIDGREPNQRDLAKYRRKGEESDPERPVTRRRRVPTLGESIDVNRSSMAAETETHWVFEIPLRKTASDRFPPEKFRVQARVAKEGRTLENISVLLRESFRSMVVIKVKSGEASLDFARINPKYPPALVAISGDADWSVLFFGSGRSLELKRTELRHVKPYAERFEVKIGTLKALDF